MRLQILHVTTYAYRAPVALLAHRMMLSPRGSHALRPISADLSCEPAAEFEWTQDVFGNLIATASFQDPTERVVITNRVTVEQTAAAWPVFQIAPHAHRYPFDYSHDERTDLGALLVPEHPDPKGRLADWARALVLGGDTDTLSLLQDVNAAARIAKPGIAIFPIVEHVCGHPSDRVPRHLGTCVLWRRHQPLASLSARAHDTVTASSARLAARLPVIWRNTRERCSKVLWHSPTLPLTKSLENAAVMSESAASSASASDPDPPDAVTDAGCSPSAGAIIW